MKRSNIRLNKRGKITILILGIFILIIFFRTIINKNRNIFNYYEENKKYNIKINYDKSDIGKLDNEVKKFILSEKDNFMIEVKNKKDDNIKYDLIIDSSLDEYKNILFIHVWSYKFTGGNHYNRQDISFAYNKLEKKLLTIKDFLNNDEDIKNLDLLTKVEILNYCGENNIEIENSIIDNIFNNNVSTYKHFNLDDNGLTIIFPPYVLSSWSDGEIIITISWKKLNNIIKKDYFSKKFKEEKNNNKKEARNLEKYKDKKLIAFTFDDGPNRKTTIMLLDYLKEMDAKVTFFMVGSRVSSFEDVVRRAYLEGHDIGSHTYSHRNLTKISDSDIIEEVNKTNNILKNITGEDPIYIRPPYGDINNHVNKLISMHNILWNIDSSDWRLKNREKIKNEILKDAHDGAIVLVHDIYEESVMGAILAINELEKDGYAFVTITEMAKLKNKSLDMETIYTKI